MFWLGFSIGLMVGATVGLFIYALIFTAKRADEMIENGGEETKTEWCEPVTDDEYNKLS